MGNKNMKIRVAWIIPNVFMYVLFFGFGSFVLSHANGLRDINRLGIWVFMLIMLLCIALFGSYQIRSWIKQGKI
ncbi:hypothetical protein [Paenibacillus sp. MMS18-CY102]|uniref:hypothetical protein n=1 Tax=Paenibacillus sp. MMS18-CY102 TaxID=2682849 RepID=UPI001F417E4D|nr:hypothetical protein [Paenibacillus sp. MMS18-CY102]